MKAQYLSKTASVYFFGISVFLFSASGFAKTSPLCDELARFSCAPGSYKDGTGEVKSESEVSEFIASYSAKSRASLLEKFGKVIDDPANSYFKDVAMAGLGLKNSPQCTSSAPDDVSTCRANLIDGLATLAQKVSLAPLLPQAGLARPGDLEDLGYIVQNKVYEDVIDELNDQVQKDLGNPELTQKIQDEMFPKIKDLIAARLKKLSIPDAQKKLMITKLNSISFEGSNCQNLEQGQGGTELVSALLVPNAFYYPARNTFKVCSGLLLQSTSEFEIAQAIAHELSHSIDPCGLASGPKDMGFKYSDTDDLAKMEQEYPLSNVIQCLRDPRSIGARNFSGDTSQMCPGCPPGGAGGYPMPTPPGYPGGGTINVGLTPTMKAPPKPDFCENDQINESFCDWMASEVVPTYIEQNHKLTTEQYRNGYANTFRSICSIVPEGSLVTSVHPPVDDRINKIMLANPKVRGHMGCPAKHPEVVYCDSENPIPQTSDSRQIMNPQIPSDSGKAVQ